ncbi:DUF4359 domain-containing protein [Okeania sp.]|uniref:DUF4359 domain-containing protein n=1 Tax=Okeania sp. TaxID=3100323 RepID=UPI002B4AE174|nr:DUF4359 domain-containing protein [Okeania sp.]MEB3340297.1 DUF4359 domain-containing protein [Okeania sp.]
MSQDKKSSSYNKAPLYWGLSKVGIIFLTVGATVMGFTNPPRDEYVNYASNKLATEIKESVCKESNVPEVLNNLTGDLLKSCEKLIKSQRTNIKEIMDNATKRQNLILFSLYTTEFTGKRYQTIGAVGNFLTFPPQKIDKNE